MSYVQTPLQKAQSSSPKPEVGPALMRGMDSERPRSGGASPDKAAP